MKINKITEIFAALSQENRFNIFMILVKSSPLGITPGEIAIKMNDMPRNTVSFHLNILHVAGLCSFEKKGKRIIYKPQCSIINEVTDYLLKDCCCQNTSKKNLKNKC